MRSQTRRLAAPITALTLALALVACASDDSAAPTASPPPETGAPQEAVSPASSPRGGDTEASAGDSQLNEADVMFLEGMIPHHDQANQMAELVRGRTERPELEEFAQGVLAVQSEEIEEMSALLEAGGEVAGGMEGMDHQMEGMEQMPGMMDEGEMVELEQLQGQQFDLRFVEMMIEHHEGAIAMAEMVLDQGENPQVADLATRIIEAQQAEIEQLRRWQEDWA